MVDQDRLCNLQRHVREKTHYALSGIRRAPQGCLKHEYLVPAGPYEEQWDWDAFFMALALIKETPQNAYLMRNWVLNYLENVRADGWVAGCLTAAGADPRLYHVKPLLAKGALIYCQTTNDVEWLRPWLPKLVQTLRYREENLWNFDYDLPVWYDSMESGADNNLASLNFPPKSVISADICAFVYSEYAALSTLCDLLGDQLSREHYLAKAAGIKQRFEKHCFCETQQAYLNVDVRTGAFIQCMSYAAFVPLALGMVSNERAQKMIARYLLAPEHLKCDFGFRTLSKSHPGYNNINMIKPHSNWQGPVWPIANFIYMQALLRYGFEGLALEVAEQTIKLVLHDIDQTGGMHENYHAETGAPLAAPGFVSWNLLVRSMVADCFERQLI